MEDTITRRIWNGQLPMLIRGSDAKRADFMIMVHRCSYLTSLADDVAKWFEWDVKELWFEKDGEPLKWYVSVHLPRL